MTAPLGYLLLRSARNRLVRRLMRLRQPRYLVALALGLSYLGLIVAQQRPTPPEADAARAAVVELAGALAAALAAAWAWVIAAERRALAFSPAEVTFLFSGPVTRRQLVHFKLLRTQLVILLNTLLWSLLLSGERFGVSASLRAASLWVLFTTLSLHRLGASFVRTSLVEHGRSGARRRIVSLTAVLVVVAALGWAAADAASLLVTGWDKGIGAFLGAAVDAAERPAARALLLPFRLLVAPLTADSPASWGAAMLPALALLAAHYVWVVRSDTAFEEAAAEESLRRAERLAGPRAPRRSHPANRKARPLYRLRPVGHPAEAIFWKNLTGVARTSRVRGIAAGFLVAGALAAALSFRAESHLAEIVGWLAMMWAGFLVLVGAQWVRSDLRADLVKLDLLRSYPLRGPAILAAEVAASTVVLTALQLGVAGVAYLALLGNDAMEPGLGARTGALALAALILPAVNLLGLLIQNGAAILYPGWVHIGSERPGGVEALGQNMLALMAHVVLLSLALLVPAATAAGVFLLLENAAGWWAVAPAALAGLAPAAVEARIAIEGLGRVLERTDAAVALAP